MIDTHWFFGLEKLLWRMKHFFSPYKLTKNVPYVTKIYYYIVSAFLRTFHLKETNQIGFFVVCTFKKEV